MAGETDLDGDSQMHSSASSASDDMFPEENTPATPQNRHIASGVADAELSPPNSQERGGQSIQMPLLSQDAMDTGEPWTVRPTAAPKDAVQGKGAAKGKEVEKPPGWGWQNPKAREEYERALEAVLDRGFTLREFGELFDEKDLPQNPMIKR